MTDCQTCGAKTDYYICAECEDDLHSQLTQLPTWLRHLTETATGQTRLGGNKTKHHRGDTQPMPVNLNASQLHAEINTGLGTWIRHLSHSTETPALPTPAQRAWWLAGHTHHIACNEEANELIIDITDWTERIQRTVDRPPARHICGPCPTTIEQPNGTKHPCNLELSAPDPDATITCPRCHTQHKARNLRQTLILRARYLPLTQAMILRALDQLGEPLDRTTFIGWTKPNTHGLIRVPIRATDPNTGEPRYWLDDARKVQRRNYPPRRASVSARQTTSS
jgi:hypothetical protein